jgi:hypothetical protein
MFHYLSCINLATGEDYFDRGVLFVCPIAQQVDNTMNSDVKKHFKYLELVREDIRDELELLDLSVNALRICDFGCGNGLTTYSLALEVERSECIGVDKFDGESSPTLNAMLQYTLSVKSHCEDQKLPRETFPGDLCRLIHEQRAPQFRKGDIVLGQNLPHNVDVAYCKRILVNIFHGKHGNIPLGEEGLIMAINHISSSVRPEGLVCVIEYEGFVLEKYVVGSNLHIIDRKSIERRDIRSRGRTTVTSKYALYLCQKA